MTTEDILRHATQIAGMAAVLDGIVRQYSEEGTPCECCSAVRYRNFPQKQMRERLVGAVERLRGIVDVLNRRASDPVFLDGIPSKEPV